MNKLGMKKIDEVNSKKKISRSISDKVFFPNPKKNKLNEPNGGSSSRFLIIINVLGSSGPIRFIVNGDDTVRTVIDKALKRYAREGRIPALDSNTDNFLLHPSDGRYHALNPSEKIGRCGVRIVALCKRQVHHEYAKEPRIQIGDDKKGNKLRAWVQKSFSFKILSH